MIAHYLIDPEQRHSLDHLSRTVLNHEPISIETLIGSKTKPNKSMEEVPVDQLKDYAAEDADITFQLYESFEKDLVKLDLQQLFYEVEMPLVAVLNAMERKEITINTDALNAVFFKTKH